MNIESLIVPGILALGIVSWMLIGTYRHKFLVQEGFTGLLYHEGKLEAALPAGCHIRWGRYFHVQPLEARRSQIQIPGQEVLTSDNITVKLSVVLTIQIADAVKAIRAADSYHMHVYTAAQTALRTAVAEITMEALLAQRAAISGRLIELIGPKADAVGVQVYTADVRDVMLPGELRKAFSEVLKAKQDAQVALERARSESASLRNLANAARLVEGLPSLATLRFFQTLESAGAGQTLLVNDLSSILPALRVRKGQAVPVDEAQRYVLSG